MTGIKKDYISEPLLMTDHYNLLCYLLGIKAQPNNGTWAKVKHMTSDSGALASKLIDINSALKNQTVNNLIILLFLLLILTH